MEKEILSVLEKYTLHEPIEACDIWSMRMPTPNSSVPTEHVTHGYYVIQNALDKMRE